MVEIGSGRFYFMERYSEITEKAKREIVLLRGKGCAYKKCVFCDYHTDFCLDETENFILNSGVLSRVTGRYGDLEVINSGSVFELDENTLSLISEICEAKNIKTLHFESHYMYKDLVPALRKRFFGVDLKMKLGLETFDYGFRENVLKKGIPEHDPVIISEHFDEANFLFGISGQTVESMLSDIALGKKYFGRICVNVMCENSTRVVPDKKVVSDFLAQVYPLYKDDERVDILVRNTDFGVGS